ncbi:poly(beta-D-mannuronate) lyase [Sphingomonas sp. So64.6b]|uniref:polysaccharide lyase 6 family protein n=1 Tax=Sphingomonas sp. So64.6b TaxID=2997354 RepID=UPI0016045AEA|nr:polysaccharide lyase 6 family protein [Sphingomonas sp. So64.6b]QNA85400.1 poly(beta-D-mannuronate) lyase [Sphingomonas sp. So64.6b]
MRAFAITAAATVLAGAAPLAARETLVHDQVQYREAVARMQAGDTIVLADGEWRDAALTFSGEGKAGQPITLTAQHSGRVILTGRSSLKLAGRYLVASNLVFRDGHAPGDEVIAFRTDSKHWAEHSRITGIVIDRFNNPDRRREDHWVAIYGSDNRVDHSHFEGKQNAGAMMVVVRQKGMPLDNRIRIDHVYFGPRPPLGSNGGETIRIGTSTESASDSHTIVEDNLFEQCDGEVEIVSIKSGGNVVRRNLFLKSQGSVVLRHGSGNIVEDNVFLGQGVAHSGGIRVINERQTIRNNYMEGLAGIDFTSAIAVMNGVPNSPVNRYMPVRQALIEHNSLIDVARVTIGAGADAERSQAPRETRIADNLITGAGGQDPLRIEADIAGVQFADNVVDAKGVEVAGLARRTVQLARAKNGLLYPVDPKLAALGVRRDLVPITREQIGVAWYAKPASREIAFGAGPVVRVTPAQSLSAQIGTAAPGSVFELAAGSYAVTEPLALRSPLTFRAAERGGATLRMAAATLFQIEEGGSLALDGVVIDGAGAPRQSGNAVIRSSARPMLGNYRLAITGTRFEHLDSAPGFDVLATTPATLAGDISIRDSAFTGVSGAVLALAAESGKQGWYGAEQVSIVGSQFDKVSTVTDVLRSGSDESTFGPRFTLSGSTITGSGAIKLSGVQETAITGNRFQGSGGIQIIHSVGSPHTLIRGNTLGRTPPPTVIELAYKGRPRAVIADNEKGL